MFVCMYKCMCTRDCTSVRICVCVCVCFADMTTVASVAASDAMYV